MVESTQDLVHQKRFLTMEPTTETICDKARRLAREEDERNRQEIVAQKQAFLDQFGLTAQFENEYQYDLCGYRWTCVYNWYRDAYVLYLVWHTLPEKLAYYTAPTDLISLGRLVIQLDEEKAEAAARSIQAITNPKPRLSWWKKLWRGMSLVN